MPCPVPHAARILARQMPEFDYDFAIVGSGFGGSVSALRLVGEGLLASPSSRWASAGARRTSRRPTGTSRKFALAAGRWACTASSKMTVLRDVIDPPRRAASAAASLVYANTLLVPPDAVFDDRAWVGLATGRARCAPHYATAQRMLGACRAQSSSRPTAMLQRGRRRDGPRRTRSTAPTSASTSASRASRCPIRTSAAKGPSARAARCAAAAWSAAATARRTRSTRTTCTSPRSAARASFPRHASSTCAPLDGRRLRADPTEHSTRARGIRGARCARASVVVSAGSLGTVELLMRCKERGSLPGALERARRLRAHQQRGARSASARSRTTSTTRGHRHHERRLHRRQDAHRECVRYPAGSDALAPLATLLTDGGPPWPRSMRWIGGAPRTRCRSCARWCRSAAGAATA